MSRIYEIISNNIVISTTLPLLEILEVEITHRENTHGCARVLAHIQSEEDINRYLEEKVYIYKMEEHRKLLFVGTAERIITKKEGTYRRIEILAYSMTYQLEGENYNRSFQDISVTYAEVVDRVTQDWGGMIGFKVDKEKSISEPLIQYQENNWQFLKRLASHLHIALYSVLTVEKAVNIGWNLGKERQGGQIVEEGLDELFYTKGKKNGFSDKKQFQYLHVVHTEEWQIGDYLIHNHIRFTVYRRIIKYNRGEITYFYELGTEGITYCQKQRAEHLKGARLKGVIRQVKQESISLQLDIDVKEECSYFWPWTPEVGNICYLMPEVGTRALLYFPSGKEGDGIALHLLRDNSSASKSTDYKELVTAEGKALKLYPQEITLETAAESLKLSDQSGIFVDSGQKIRLIAAGNIRLNGNSVSVIAPNRIVCKTNVSNMEICKSFNFYAPNGVEKSEKTKDGVNSDTDVKQEKCTGYYQASFASLAAIPAIDFSTDAGEAKTGLMASGSVPRIGNGTTTFAMMEAMEGKKKSEVSFPDALDSMDNYTNNGSYLVPEE